MSVIAKSVSVLLLMCSPGAEAAEGAIARESAIQTAKAHLKSPIACSLGVEKVSAIYFSTGSELRDKFPVRGETPNEDLIKPDRPYWMVLMTLKFRGGRAINTSADIDALTGQPVGAPPEGWALCLEHGRTNP